MSDHLPPTPPGGNDRVRDTLTALRVDADSCSLVDPANVRRRGQARTRHQALAGVCAAVVVVSVVVTGGSLLGGQGDAHHTLPATPSPAPAPSPSPTATAAMELAPDPLLHGGDVAVAGTQLTFQLSPDPVPETQRPLQCIPSPTTLGAADGEAAQLFADPNGTVVEHVLRFGDATAAADAVTELSVAFASCTKGNASEVTVDDRGPVRANGIKGVTETLNAARLTTPTADAGVSYYELGIARSSNIVVVLEWSSLGKPVTNSRLGCCPASCSTSPLTAPPAADPSPQSRSIPHFEVEELVDIGSLTGG